MGKQTHCAGLVATRPPPTNHRPPKKQNKTKQVHLSVYALTASERNLEPVWERNLTRVELPSKALKHCRSQILGRGVCFKQRTTPFQFTGNGVHLKPLHLFVSGWWFLLDGVVIWVVTTPTWQITSTHILKKNQLPSVDVGGGIMWTQEKKQNVPLFFSERKGSSHNPDGKMDLRKLHWKAISSEVWTVQEQIGPQASTDIWRLWKNEKGSIWQLYHFTTRVVPLDQSICYRFAQNLNWVLQKRLLPHVASLTDNRHTLIEKTCFLFLSKCDPFLTPCTHHKNVILNANVSVTAVFVFVKRQILLGQVTASCSSTQPQLQTHHRKKLIVKTCSRDGGHIFVKSQNSKSWFKKTKCRFHLVGRERERERERERA